MAIFVTFEPNEKGELVEVDRRPYDDEDEIGLPEGIDWCNVRECSRCHKVKTMDNFRKHANGYRFLCKECYNADERRARGLQRYTYNYVFTKGVRAGRECGTGSSQNRCAKHREFHQFIDKYGSADVIPINHR